MAWYADLDNCSYFGESVAHLLKAIGWLERGNPYATGDISEQIFFKLCQLIQKPWNPVYTAGFHCCSLCQFTDGSVTQYKGYTVSGLSNATVIIPGDGILYISPTSIAHYIDAHNYKPPDAYCEAIMGCPEMGSMAYKRSLLSNGGRELIKAFNVSFKA